MSFIKRASIKSMPVQALNKPEGKGWDLYNLDNLKVASFDKSKKGDIGGFDLKAALKEHPNHLFVKAFAIKENEVNDNGDAFSPEELKKAAHTFIDCPVFVNHQNDDVEKARGKVVHAWYDEDAGGIYVINRVDKEAYPPLARGIEEGYIIGTSMGAQVGYSCCSACHNKAATKDEFCDHIKHRKNKKITRTLKCAFHDSPCKPDGACPVCNCKKGESKENDYKEAQIHEWNYDIKFIEDSFVVSPACHDCLVCEILNVPKIESHLASSVEKLRKLASALGNAVDSGGLEKTAGMKEVSALNEAMNLIEGVARSMMAQKQIVSMEYVSDLVEQLSKIQDTTDELIEMGYSQIPSPPQSDVMLGNHQQASPGQGGAQQFSDPNAMLGQQAPMQSFQAPPGGGSASTAPVGGGVATVTKPSFSITEKEFSKIAANMYDSIQKIRSGFIAAENNVSPNRRSSVFNINDSYTASSGNFRVVVAKAVTGDVNVAEFNGSKLIRMESADTFDGDMQKLLAEQPQEAAERILTIRSGSKEFNVTMANEKTAAGQGVTQEQTEIITQKQLESKIPLHPRQNKPYETTTEGDDQLAGKEKSNDTTSENGQVRKGSYDTITQDQLASIQSGYLTRFNDFPEVITEKQWDEMSRSVDAVLPDDWTSEITQAQLISLRDNHRWENPEVITQGQLDDQGKTMPSIGETARWKAASTDIGALVKAAAAAVTTAIANYGLSPRDISSAVSRLTATPQSQMKSAYLTLINAVPAKIANRSAELSRRSYFEGKVASNGLQMSPVDAMVAAMADNIGYLKAENFVDAVRRVVANKTAFARAEADALLKIASGNDVAEVVDLDAQFNNAMSSLGTHRVSGHIKTDINVDPSDPAAFSAAVYAFASKKVGGKTILASIDTEGDIFEAVLKDCTVCSKAEIDAFAEVQKNNFKSAAGLENFKGKAAPAFGKKDEDKKDSDKKDDKGDEKDGCMASRSNARNEIVKQAQMMGGQMGGGMGDGGGQGASMPPAPGMGAGDPVQSFGQDPMAGGLDGMDAGGDSDLQPSPPGTYCPVCTSEDVDLVAGKGKCNNCTSEFIFKISVDVTKWAGLTDGGAEGEEPGVGEEDGEGEGIALPEPESGGGMEESLPVAAATYIKPEALRKMAAAKINFGSVSPYSGTTRTTNLGMENGANKFLCHATGLTYAVRTASKGERLFAQWEYQDHLVEPCATCRRSKVAFAKALNTIGETEESFHRMNRRARGSAVLKMAASGALKQVKTASKTGSVLDEYKKVLAFVPEGKFPAESCREVLARKWGEDAIALSGPDEGSNLVDSVCKRLAKASIYSDRLAIKIAEIWSVKDGCVRCLEDHIRAGFDAENSALICQAMKHKYAQAVELLADDIGSDPMGDVGGDIDGALAVDVSDPAAGGFDDGMGGDVDPFAPDAAQQGFVSVEIPMDVLQHIDQAFDKALGIDPSTEPHHDAGALPGGDATLEMPIDAVEQIEQVTDPALDQAVETGEVPSVDGGEAPAPGDETSFEEEAIGGGDAPAEEPSEEPAAETPFGGDEGGESEGDEPSDDKPDGDGDDSGGNPFAESSDEKKESSNSTRKVVAETNGDASFMNGLNRSKIAGTGRVTNLNLDGVVAALRKSAGESGLTQKNVQDDSETKPYGGDGGSAMGHEEGFKAAEPDVPSKGSGATMGKESKDLMPTDNTEIPAGGGEMGHEKEQGYTAEKGHEFTGGVDGAGSSKAASRAHQGLNTRAMTSDLASRLVKIATEQKTKAPAQLKDDSDIGTVSDNKDHSNTPDKMKITPFEESDNVDVPEAGSGAFMGHEEESIGAVPKSPEHQPSIPAGGGKNSKFDKNEKNNPEKQDHIKGTVIAGGDEKSLLARKSAAEKLAGKMIERGILRADEISAKIASLSRYQVEEILDQEKALFGVAGKKGLDTVAKGLQTPLVINASKNQKQDAATELKDKLQGLFSLSRKNALAENDPEAQLRRQR